MPAVAVLGNETLLCFREIGDSSFFDRGRFCTYFLGFFALKENKGVHLSK